MNELLSQYLGKILLGLAVVWAIVAAVLNAPQGPVAIEDEGKASNWGITQVKLKVKEPDANVPAEAFFVTLSDLVGPDRKIFPTRIEKIKQYETVELEIPDATVARAPMVLPSPGPSLPGASKLPRWGDEMPPIPAPPKPKKGDGGGANPAAPAPAPAAPASDIRIPQSKPN